MGFGFCKGVTGMGLEKGGWPAGHPPFLFYPNYEKYRHVDTV
jgi:hypothetical protein